MHLHFVQHQGLTLTPLLVLNCLHISVHCNFYSIVVYYEFNVLGWLEQLSLRYDCDNFDVVRRKRSHTKRCTLASIKFYRNLLMIFAPLPNYIVS